MIDCVRKNKIHLKINRKNNSNILILLSENEKLSKLFLINSRFTQRNDFCSLLPTNFDKFLKHILLEPQVKINNVRVNMGNQIHSNTELPIHWVTKSIQTRSSRGVGKLNRKSLNVGVQNPGLCQKLMCFVKPFCWHPRQWGARS